MRRKKVILFFSFAVVILVIVMGLSLLRVKESSPKFLQEGDTLPTSITSKYQGKVLLINFWASWCEPCMDEMPSLVKLQKLFANKNFIILAIDLDDDFARGTKELETNIGKTNLQLLPGHGSELLSKMRIVGVPHTIVADRHGVIRYSEGGARNWMDSDAKKIIEDLL